MKRMLFILLLCLLPLTVFAADNIVNVYAWSGEVSDDLIKQFEKETGIKVNFSTYQSNEVMFAKLRTSAGASYDVVMPSSYFIDRMRKLKMIAEIDKSKVPNLKNLSPEFQHTHYDPTGSYSVPFLWGVTGIFVNSQYIDPKSIRTWQDLWNPKFDDQLLMLDDTRELFSMALISLGYSPDETNPTHITQAFDKLQQLMKNVKVFSSETVISILIDEDAMLGMCWNGDAYKASRDNKNIKFIFPEDGFLMWIDNFAVPAGAPHKNAAYAFINFMLRPESGRETALSMNYPITNKAGQQLLPPEIRNNPIIYPPANIMKRALQQRDLNEETQELYEKYWEKLKMSA